MNLWMRSYFSASMLFLRTGLLSLFILLVLTKFLSYGTFFEFWKYCLIILQLFLCLLEFRDCNARIEMMNVMFVNIAVAFQVLLI